MAQYKILVVDDNADIREVLQILLVSEGYQVVLAQSGEEALERMDDAVDLVILDIMMPGMSGIRVCEKIRQTSNVPILFLTAKSQDGDISLGLRVGADDYLVKPFAFEELLARIRVLLRKPADVPTACYRLADLEVHTDTHKVMRAGEEIRLSGKEFSLLRYMIQNQGIVLSRNRLEQHLWNFDYAGGSNVIDVYIRYLRKKIDEGHDKKLIHTVRGAGYVLKEQE